MANKDNPGRGARFETLVQRFFAGRRMRLQLHYSIPIGFDGVVMSTIFSCELSIT